MTVSRLAGDGVMQGDVEEDDGYVRQVAVDVAAGDVFIRLEGTTWIRCRRATIEGKSERAAAVALKGLVVCG